MKDKISNLELGVLNYFLTRAFFIGITFNCLIKFMKQDSSIIPLISIILGYIIICLNNIIFNYKPNLNVAEKIKTLFKGKSSTILILLIFILCLNFCFINSVNLNNFIHSQFLAKTPVLVICIFFMIAAVYVLSKDILSISRTSVILFYIGFSLFLLTAIALIPTAELSNLKPIFQFKFKNIFEALNCYYAFNLTPIFLLTIIPKDTIKSKNIKLTLLISYIVSAITLFLVIFFTIATFGFELTKLYEYPEFNVLKHVSLLGIASRIESILVIQWIFDIFIYNVISLYFMSKCISTITNFNNQFKLINIILAVLIVFLTQVFSRYNIFMNNILIKYTSIITTIVTIFITLLIVLKIKSGKKLPD